jgi:acyl-coenzyme A synthetase/AMP-(fatty) acid ligase
MPSLLANLRSKICLVERTECNTLIVADSLNSITADIHTERPNTKIFRAPGLTEWFNEIEADIYPFTKTFDEAKDDPILIYHTSGTTSG